MIDIRLFILGPVQNFEDRKIALREIEVWINELIDLLESEE